MSCDVVRCGVLRCCALLCVGLRCVIALRFTVCCIALHCVELGCDALCLVVGCRYDDGVLHCADVRRVVLRCYMLCVVYVRMVLCVM